jgi:hypothetical protein
MSDRRCTSDPHLPAEAHKRSCQCDRALLVGRPGHHQLNMELFTSYVALGDLRLTLSRMREDLTMKNPLALTALTIINLGLLVMIAVNRTGYVEASSPSQVIRARGIEIVDAQGKARASLSIIPAGPARRPDGRPVEANGKTYPETVLFRLIRPDGRPSVKIATSEQGSSIYLSGGIDPTDIVLNSDGGEASLTLTNRDGRSRVIKP